MDKVFSWSGKALLIGRLLRMVPAAGCLLWATTFSASAQILQTIDRPIALKTPEDVADLWALERAAREVAARVLPAIVAVGFRYEKDPLELPALRFASGVLIGEDGLILSQYHVSHTGPYDDEIGLRVYGQPGDEVDVILSDGRRLKAELLGGERLADISLLRLIKSGPYPYINLASEEPVELGEWVIKFGHPAGYQPQRGAVSRLGRVVYVNPVNIVADCRTAGGDSGGPLVNLQGKIVGIITDSSMPLSVMEVASDGGALMAYMPAKKIQAKMGSMLAGVVPHETTFDDNDERRHHYAQVETILPLSDGSRGGRIIAAWQSVAQQARNCVVEVLDRDMQRAALGTVLAEDGWLITKASSTEEYPHCRLPDGKIVAARRVGMDANFDIALLKANAEHHTPVRWATDDSFEPNRLVMAPGIDALPLAAGVVSAPLHSNPIWIANEKIHCGGIARAFEHNMSLQPSDHGGPVFNLDGEAIGITIADAGPHGCLGIAARDVLAAVERIKP